MTSARSKQYNVQDFMLEHLERRFEEINFFVRSRYNGGLVQKVLDGAIEQLSSDCVQKMIDRTLIKEDLQNLEQRYIDDQFDRLIENSRPCQQKALDVLSDPDMKMICKWIQDEKMGDGDIYEKLKKRVCRLRDECGDLCGGDERGEMALADVVDKILLRSKTILSRPC